MLLALRVFNPRDFIPVEPPETEDAISATISIGIIVLLMWFAGQFFYAGMHVKKTRCVNPDIRTCCAFMMFIAPVLLAHSLITECRWNPCIAIASVITIGMIAFLLIQTLIYRGGHRLW